MTKPYHITQEQVYEIALRLDKEGFNITADTNGYIEAFGAKEFQAFANAVLDEVLGEPAGYVNKRSLEMLKDRQQDKYCATLWRTTGILDSAGVALYAPRREE